MDKLWLIAAYFSFTAEFEFPLLKPINFTEMTMPTSIGDFFFAANYRVNPFLNENDIWITS